MAITKKAVENDALINKYFVLLEKLEIDYKKISIYILAFTHRSIVNERPDFAPNHNERLEFLWDAVLELIITNNLFEEFTEKAEWELTDIRSAIVRWSNLAKIAIFLWLPEYLLLWKWEEMSGWRENNYILANVVEALLWAIYSDIWFTESKKFVNKYIYPSVKEILKNNLTKDYKTIIQEYAQAKFDITPKYIELNESWPDHDKIFVIWIYLNDKIIWKGEWSSKKKAQEKAAENWYNNIKN